MADTKRIAKNTVILYLRMLFTMGIGLYTSRMLLEQLGVDAFGIYNVVGGLIVMVAFINSAMSSATQRYINYEKGTGHPERLQNVFSTSLSIHLIIAFILVIIAEILGPWVLNTYLHIPKELLSQANWVYQFTVISFSIGVATVPYMAIIVAYEKMSIFAMGAVVESILKLLSAVGLMFIPSNRLGYYGFFILLTSLIGRAIYIVFSLKNFPETHHFTWLKDKRLAKEMVSFSGWSVVGSLGYSLHSSGIAFVINLFFTAAVNAAQGLANQINGLVQGFIGNFLIALNPQIVQSYAAKNLEDMHLLIYRGCRIALFLTSIIVVPFIISCKQLLSIWLTTVPEYTTGFVQVILWIALVSSFTPVLSTAQNATGQIKKYQVVLTLVGLLHVPLTLIAFWLGGSPLWAIYVYLGITIFLQVYRIDFVSKSVGINKSYMYWNVIFRSLVAMILSGVLPLIWRMNVRSESILITLLISATAVCTTIIFYFLIALSQSERQYITSFVKAKFQLSNV